MLALGVVGLKEYIKTIGLFTTKAENVIKTCAILLERHGGRCRRIARPRAPPGVGRKTANVVLNTAFGWPTIAVRHPHLPGVEPHLASRWART